MVRIREILKSLLPGEMRPDGVSVVGKELFAFC